MLIGLLLATVVVAAIGDRFGLPWPALLTIVVAPALFIPGVPEWQVPAELILPIFLPPLLWSLARRTSWGQIKAQKNVILSMSIVLVFLTIAALTGSAMLLLPGIGVAAAVVLASALAPPDPVAVDAVAGPAGIPKRITSTLQTEGLFNDAASIVTFHVALTALVAGSDISWGEAVGSFFYSAIAAVIIGLLLGRLSAWFIDHVHNHAARTALTWVVPFAVYLIAEEVHASGVIAIVIAAVEMHSRATVTSEDRLSGHSFWETVEMLFTGVAFGLIGLSFRSAIESVGSHLWHAVFVGVMLSLVAILLRFVWMWVLYRVNIAKAKVYSAPLRMQEVLLMSWSGMRGLVTLALVMSIPAGSFHFHHELTVIALTVLVCTMAIPGLTLPWLVSKLDMDSGPDAAGDIAIAKLNVRVREAAFKTMAEKWKELDPESMAEIQAWMAREMPEEELDPETYQERKERRERKQALMRQIRIEALRAGEAEMLKARTERDINPAYVDEVLDDIDRKIFASGGGSLERANQDYLEEAIHEKKLKMLKAQREREAHNNPSNLDSIDQ